MIEKIAHKLTRKPKLVATIALLMLIPSIIGYAATRINYDILSYLPQDLPSSQGEQLLEEPFQMAATSMLIVEGMPAGYTNRLIQDIKAVPGVSSAVWISNLVGIQIPVEMIPMDLRDMFFSGQATMMLIQYDHPGASDETMESIQQVRDACNQNCFLAGFSVVIKDTRDVMDGELPIFVGLAVLLALLAMSVTLESTVLPFVYLASIGMAVVYNFGSNVFLGQISYITKAIAAVLQLGVTMDYSIFLYDRYREEAPHYEDKRDAMAVSIVAAFKSLFGSSLTTIAGFLALCFMRLTLGRDIGLVMAKGVVLGIATVILVLPAILLLMDGPIQKHRHRCLKPDTTGLNAFVVRHSKGFVILFLLLFLPAIYANNHTQMYYKLDEAVPQDMPSIVANNKLKDEFDMASTHFIVMSDSVDHASMKELTERIDALPGITSSVAYDKLLPDGIPDFFIPKDIKDICKQDGYQMLMVNSKYVTASDLVGEQLTQLDALLKEYDPDAYITGEAAMTNDLIWVANEDFRVTSYLSILAIFLLVAIAFKSISIPVLLVATIELAIFINQGIPYFTGTEVAFITPTVISCIQLGATVDYAILMTTRFQEELQKGLDRKIAIQNAAKAADVSILTSALVFFCATLGVSLVSTMDLISSICLMLSRGAIISAFICMFILPSVLVTFEPVIAKTTLHWRTPKPPRERKRRKSEAVQAEVPAGEKIIPTEEESVPAGEEKVPAMQGKESDIQ